MSSRTCSGAPRGVEGLEFLLGHTGWLFLGGEGSGPADNCVESALLTGVRLLSGELNGLSLKIGIAGLQSGSVLNIHTQATANRVTAATSSCPLQIQNLDVWDRIAGYVR